MKSMSLPLILALVAAPGVCQTAGQAPALPPALQIAAQEIPVAAVSARGVQIYECRDSGGRPGWAFVAPDAELFDNAGRPFGKHGAGPTWQATDGSIVVGEVTARAAASAAGAIPWLLLKARSTGSAGALAGVTRIRRVHTAGGLAPDTGCDAGSLGKQARVPYTADYLLYSGSPT